MHFSMKSTQHAAIRTFGILNTQPAATFIGRYICHSSCGWLCGWMDGWVFFTDCITFYLHLRKWLYFNRLGFIWLVDYKLHSFWANQFIAFEFSSRSLQLFFKHHTMLLQLCIFESKRPTNIRNGIYFVKIISFTKQTDSAIHNVYLVVRLNHLALDSRNNIINNK